MRKEMRVEACRAALSEQGAVSIPGQAEYHTSLHGDKEMRRAWSARTRKMARQYANFLDKYTSAKHTKAQTYVEDPQVDGETHAGKWRQAYVQVDKLDGKFYTIQVLRYGFAKTLEDDEWRLREVGTDPRHGSWVALQRYNPNVDPEYRQALLDGIRSTRTVTNPKTREGKTYTASFLVLDSWDKQREDGACEIRQLMFAWMNTTPTYDERNILNNGGPGEDTVHLAECVPLDSAEGMLQKLAGTAGVDDWAQNTAYEAGDFVKQTHATYGLTNVYLCLEDHTSTTGGTVDDDFSTDFRAGKWRHIVGSQYANAGRCEAHVTKVERTGDVLEIESLYRMEPGDEDRETKRKTWYQVPIGQYDYWWAQAKAYDGGLTDPVLNVQSQTASNGYSVIWATAQERETDPGDGRGTGGVIPQFNGRSGVIYDFDRWPTSDGDGYYWVPILIEWTTGYHGSESAAYTAIAAGSKGSTVSKVGGVILWRSYLVTRIQFGTVHQDTSYDIDTNQTGLWPAAS